jgi:hypothetical protein
MQASRETIEAAIALAVIINIIVLVSIAAYVVYDTF